MGLRRFTQRADQAVQTVKDGIGWSMAASVVALVIAVAALVVAIVRSK